MENTRLLVTALTNPRLTALISRSRSSSITPSTAFEWNTVDAQLGDPSVSISYYPFDGLNSPCGQTALQNSTGTWGCDRDISVFFAGVPACTVSGEFYMECDLDASQTPGSTTGIRFELKASRDEAIR